ncbi:Ribosomal RNA small subunit methyltransferase H [Buchnera aphidicola (Cinara kochiana kochiana)]|uniref:Ribosomal RNA small subunit methyltransferase H n=1 Tax=Buchnera aphidicola (Cinara kochiana kochiana) TaxID=2518976 RepID=A0A451D5H6_9GAMM|nr:16S rRNA (cytosine(1402)-N(4))-methyltransferase RsmH [Buchnera aphidicola]VFP81062.1 Ribosomal RNA small subunit methyltransferase H [Buchnera aphidicola (Cinara kochiana kochiana)]
MLHIPVLLKESINALQIKPTGTYIDATFGSGGHSLEILKNIGPKGALYAIDQDPYSINLGKKIRDNRFFIKHGNFSHVIENLYCRHNKFIDGILLDLGISSIQIDTASRGFSFMKNGPLDMRMNNQSGIPAWKWLQKASQKKIEYVLKTFGEERYAKKISYAICEKNKKKLIMNTLDLVKIIKKIIPKKNKYKHPATRTFQAIRIYINCEIESLKKILCISTKILKKKARLVIISFHSIEGRIIKNFFKKNSGYTCIPKGLPINNDQIIQYSTKKLKIIKKIKPSNKEINKNPRARSAILRIAEIL